MATSKQTRVHAREPRLPWPLWLYSPTARWGIVTVIILGVPTSVGWYRFFTASPGCHRPLCNGGALQCCPGQGSGVPCIARPDLVGLSCAEWMLADRSCQGYFCAYAGNATGCAWLPATDTIFEATYDVKTLNGLFALTLVGTLLLGFAFMFILMLLQDIESEYTDLKRAHKQRLIAYVRTISTRAD
jgi:hypothetical protein